MSVNQFRTWVDLIRELKKRHVNQCLLMITRGSGHWADTVDNELTGIFQLSFRIWNPSARTGDGKNIGLNKLQKEFSLTYFPHYTPTMLTQAQVLFYFGCKIQFFTARPSHSSGTHLSLTSFPLSTQPNIVQTSLSE